MLIPHRETRLKLLKDPEIAAHFLNEALDSDDPGELLHALREVFAANEDPDPKSQEALVLTAAKYASEAQELLHHLGLTLAIHPTGGASALRV